MNVFDSASARVAINSLNKSSSQLDIVTKRVVSMSQTSGVGDTSDSVSVSISTRLGGLSFAMEQAIRNLEDGQSLTRTADSALADISETLIKMRELALQATSDLYTSDDKSALNNLYQNLRVHMLDIVENTKWNETLLFEKLDTKTFTIQAGPSAGEVVTFDIPQIYANGFFGFNNGDFENPGADPAKIDGWTVYNQNILMNGGSSIAGWPVPNNDTMPRPEAAESSKVGQGTFSSGIEGVVALDNPDGGANSMRLTSSGDLRTDRYGVVHGPYIVSDSAVTIKAGESISFDWRAKGGGDAYDVYAYLLNTKTGATIKLLDETANQEGGDSGWQSEETVVDADGTYKFVFISGTYDWSGGTLAGAQLFVDNIVAPPSPNPTLDQTYITNSQKANEAIVEIDLTIDTVLKARSHVAAAEKRMARVAENHRQVMLGLVGFDKYIENELPEAFITQSSSKILQSAAISVLNSIKQKSNLAFSMVTDNMDQHRNLYN